MELNREKLKRMFEDTKGNGGSANGGGGGGSLAGYATQAWVNEGFVSIDFFNRLFTVYGPGETSSDPDVVIEPNDLDSTIKNIKAMFGFWTEQYLSALGLNPGGTGSATSLSMLDDVDITTPTNGQALVYNSTSLKWENQTISTVTALANLTDVLLSSPAANQVLVYDGTNAKWYNSALKTINGQSLLGSGDISVGGGASGNYLPLTGGTLTGSNGNLLELNSTFYYGTWQYFNMSGARKVAVGVYDGMAFLSDETSGNRIGVQLGTGIPIIRMGASSGSDTYELLHTGNIGGKSINCNHYAVLILNSTDNTGSVIYYRVNGSNKAASGYYSGNAFISHEDNYARIGVDSDGNPFYQGHWDPSQRPKWLLCYEGSTPNIFPQTGNYTEGIRLHAYSGWTDVMLCASENTGRSGTSTYSWGIFNHDGYFYINRNGADAHTGYELCCINGNWGISTTSPSYKLHVDGSIYATGGITALSDIKQKNVEQYDAHLGFDEVANAPVIKFTWKDPKAEDKGLHVGSIAQYWEKVLPEAVKRDKEGTLSMSYGVVALVAAISTAKKVRELDERVTKLEKTER